MAQLTIEQAAGSDGFIRDLIDGLEAELAKAYPPEQRDRLALAALFQPNIRFFIARLMVSPPAAAAPHCSTALPR